MRDALRTFMGQMRAYWRSSLHPERITDVVLHNIGALLIVSEIVQKNVDVTL